MRIDRLTLRDFRNYDRAEVDIPDGVTVVHGPVGTGKTNLLDGLYFGCTGRSCRTSNERELIRFGEKLTRVSIEGEADGLRRRFDVSLELTPKRVKSFRADGEPVASALELTGRPLVCVFLPDRLELVKGPAGSRRAHLDAFIAALWPGRDQTRQAYARALAQRNVLVSRVRAGSATPDSLRVWNRELATAGISLMQDRSEAIECLREFFDRRALQLGLDAPTGLEYRPRSKADSVELLEQELAAALDNDLVRGFTTHGPHRDDFTLTARGRDLRRYGSQGQQRLGLLALLLAERDALTAAASATPLLLLDDVLSELDADRRARLGEAVSEGGQTLITTADVDAVSALETDLTRLPVRDGQLVA